MSKEQLHTLRSTTSSAIENHLIIRKNEKRPRQWCPIFLKCGQELSCGKYSAKHGPREERPKMATHNDNVAAVKEAVDVAGRMTLEKLEATLVISVMSLSRILKEKLSYTKNLPDGCHIF